MAKRKINTMYVSKIEFLDILNSMSAWTQVSNSDVAAACGECPRHSRCDECNDLYGRIESCRDALKTTKDGDRAPLVLPPDTNMVFQYMLHTYNPNSRYAKFLISKAQKLEYLPPNKKHVIYPAAAAESAVQV